MTKTRQEARNAIVGNGETIAKWSRDRGFNEGLVYRVLSGKSDGNYGQCFRIAVALGLRNAPPECADTPQRLNKGGVIH